MYPTRQQILKKKPRFRRGDIEITNLWKTISMKGWKNQKKWVKMEKIGLLIEALSAIHHKPSPRILLNTMYYWDQEDQTIHLDRNNPSIISALHELAHYFYGSSELRACRWSVWLFKTCFPSDFLKLNWRGHMLVK